MKTPNPIRILYSFPHKLGASRICHTAWQQVKGLAGAGAEVIVFPGVLHKPLPYPVLVRPTLARGKLRIPYRLLGRIRACALHDFIVARRLRKMAGKIDIIHTWPLGAQHTLRTAAKLGICTTLERPNTHTRFGYEVVNQECARLGITLPPTDEHFFNHEILAREEEEYQLADKIMCPSDFVLKTFLLQGVPQAKLAQHSYGYDEQVFHAAPTPPDQQRPLQVLFAGTCTVVKGLHFALEAWHRSAASQTGNLLIAGTFLPAYAQKLQHLLSHPTIKVLGQRHDIPELMRQSDVLLLPSLTEGYPLVMAEALGSGCIPLVSEACPSSCRHMVNGLRHQVGDIDTLARQLALIAQNHQLRATLRAGCLDSAPEMTWTAAGQRLLEVYRDILDARAPDNRQTANVFPPTHIDTSTQPPA